METVTSTLTLVTIAMLLRWNAPGWICFIVVVTYVIHHWIVKKK